MVTGKDELENGNFTTKIFSVKNYPEFPFFCRHLLAKKLFRRKIFRKLLASAKKNLILIFFNFDKLNSYEI